MAPIWEPTKPPADPIAERDKAAMRRKVADTLHSLARRIENETIQVEEFTMEQGLKPDPSRPPWEPADHIPTGRQTITLTFHTTPRTT